MKIVFTKYGQLNKETAGELMAALIVVGNIVGQKSELLTSLTNRLSFGVGLILILFCFKHMMFNKKIIIIWLSAILLGAINCVFVGENSVQIYLLMFVPFFSVALFCAQAKELNLALWYAVACFCCLFIMITWIRSPDGYTLFYKLSRNYLSVFFLELMFFIFLASINRKKQLPLILYIVLFLGCIIGVGRMGILVSGGLLCFVYLYRVLLENKKITRTGLINLILVLLVIICTAGIMAWRGDMILGKIFVRFAENNTSSDHARRTILMSYLVELRSLSKLLLGANSREIPYLIHWGGNVHNAFLMFHASFGLLGLIGLIGGFGTAILRFLRKKQTEFAIFLLFFLARCLTDDVFVGQLGCVMVWYSLLYLCRSEGVGIC